MITKKIIFWGIIIFAIAGCQNTDTKPSDSFKTPQEESSYSTSPPAEAIDERVLLTKDNQPSQFPNPKVCHQDFNFNDEPSNGTILYSNPEKGISFEIPYNKNWGNEKFKLNPYDELVHDEEQDEIEFGPIKDLGACNWLRPYSVKFSKQRSAEEAIKLIKDDDYIEIPPTLSKISDFTVVKYVTRSVCTNPTFELIGENYNYEFMAISCTGDDIKVQEDSKLLESIIQTVHLD